MNALVNTLNGTQHSSFGRNAESTAAMDLFVVATLSILFFLLGCFATWAWLIWRRTVRPKPHMQLLMELDEEEHQAKGEAENPKDTKQQQQQQSPEADESAPWERPGDWWKQS